VSARVAYGCAAGIMTAATVVTAARGDISWWFLMGAAAFTVCALLGDGEW
jgi:hypothetical protein